MLQGFRVVRWAQVLGFRVVCWVQGSELKAVCWVQDLGLSVAASLALSSWGASRARR